MPRYNLRLGGAKIPIAKTESSISESIGRRLQQAKPQTQVDGGGSRHQVSFAGQEISQSELREIKNIRESGGIISSALVTYCKTKKRLKPSDPISKRCGKRQSG